MAIDIEALSQVWGYWGEHPDFPVADWQFEVTNGDTRLGYWEHVEARMEGGRDG